MNENSIFSNESIKTTKTYILPMRDWGGLRISWMIFGFEQKIYKRDMLGVAVEDENKGAVIIFGF